MDAYEDVQFIDRGRFATVLKARDTNKNKIVALKKMWVQSSLHISASTLHINVSQQNSPSLAASISPRIHKNYLAHCIEREIKILKILNTHCNIIKILDTFNEDEYVIIVLEYMSIDLHQLLQNEEIQKRKLSETECKHICQQLFEGLCALHQHNIVHRDLKPANILFDSNGILKIADLGQARIINLCKKRKAIKKQKQSSDWHKNKQRAFSAVIRGHNFGGAIDDDATENESSSSLTTKNAQCFLTNEVGTRWYKAPELLYGTRKYDFSIDIWSAGCIVAEILQCKPLFCGETDIDQLCKIFNILGTINLKFYPDAVNLPDFNKIIFNEIASKQMNELWPNMSAEVIDLIECCLRFNPNSRINSNDVLKHPWFVLSDHEKYKEDEHKTEEFDVNKLNNLITHAITQLNDKRKKKQESFGDFDRINDCDDDDDDEIVSITSDILNECDLLGLDERQ